MGTSKDSSDDVLSEDWNDGQKVENDDESSVRHLTRDEDVTSECNTK